MDEQPLNPSDRPPAEKKESEIVGRNAEIDAIDGFLDRLGREAAAIVFEGHAGIGKTTVWRQVFERTALASFTVLSCRPVEAEAKLAFASLADLLEPVADAVLPQLPEPQRLALEVALMRASPHGTPPTARAVAAAVLSTLRLLADTKPVLLAIDDQQWLDRGSAETLAFALRRIGDRRVGVVATVRVTEQGTDDPLALEAAFAGRVERMRLGPLSLSVLHHIIHSHLDHVFPRPTLRRIAETCGGNPFYALELARALIEAGAEVHPGDTLPVPETLSTLVLQRLGRLTARVRETLLIASALASPTVDRVAEAAGGTDTASLLLRAEQARVIEISEQKQIRFAHPLLASALYSSASSDTRRQTHRRLAAVIASPEERARHLAMAASQPDEEVARALDEAALLARGRGAPDAAGELQERAARLTPAGDAAASRRRRTVAAEHFFHAGDRAHARALLEEVLAEPVVGAARAKALHLLGQIRGQEDSFADAVAHLEEALAHADEPALSVSIRRDLAFATFSAGDLPRAIVIAHEALSNAERLDDPGLIAEALCMAIANEVMTGRRSDRAAVERALALEDRTRPGQLLLRPRSLAGMIASYEGRFSDADVLLRQQCAWATERGEESELPFLLYHLAAVEWHRADFAATAGYAEEAIVLAEQSGSDTMRLFGHLWRCAARAGVGDVIGARADLTEASALVDKTGYVPGEIFLRVMQGALYTSLGDTVAAEDALAPLAAAAEATGRVEQIHSLFLPNAVEALIATGQASRAEALLELLARRAEQAEVHWEIASAARCRSLLAASRGDLDAAVAAAEDAVARSRLLETPVELGRALLVLGQVRRRRGERRAAREALNEALEVFRRVGAMLWVERASEELGRIPIRRGAGEDLTPTEEQVAALVGGGKTNQEVARALFMSPKTVEANLTRIYGKLGIRSRSELAVRMLERSSAGTSAKK